VTEFRRRASSTRATSGSGAPVDEGEWVADAEALSRLVDDLRRVDAYALDTEFHRERTYFARLALVQIGWRPVGSEAAGSEGPLADRVALIDPLAVDLAPLAATFENATVVLHAADQDLEVLDRACGAVPTRIFDTQVAAGFVGFSSPSLSTLAESIVGMRLPKGDRLTDWTRRPLTPAQRSYAASDVAYLLAIRDSLVADLEARGRHEWALDECALLLERSRGQQDPDTAWWRLKDGRGLRGQSRKVAQTVAAWRERRAAEMDVPTRFVLSDMALLGVANAQPRDRAALEEIRGLDTRQVRGRTGDELLAAVSAGLALPDASLRLPPVEDLDRQLRPAVALVSAWVAQLGRDLDIDPTLLATRADVQALLREDPGARLARGWRAELVGIPVRRLVAGEAALAFDGDELVLEERSGKGIGPVVERRRRRR
jgi:ribonuclease D